MHKYFIMSGTVKAIIVATTAAAALLLFEIDNPGKKASICLEMKS